MTEKLRKFKVAELNNILPIVRDCIERERTIRKLRDEIEKMNNRLVKINENLDSLEELLEEIGGKVYDKIENVKREYEEEQEKLLNLIDEKSKEQGELVKKLLEESKMCDTIVSAITTTEEGFLKEDEFKKEYFKEYIYIAVLAEIPMSKIFIFPETEGFLHDFLYDNCSIETLNEVEKIFKEKISITSFGKYLNKN